MNSVTWNILETTMRERWKPRDFRNKQEADELERQIKDLESQLKHATNSDEARSLKEDVEILDRRLCEYFC